MNKIEKYARLAIEKGMNIQKGQNLLIRASVDNVDFARLLSKVAWKNGVRGVMVQWNDEKLSRERFLYGDIDIFGQENIWSKEYINKIIDEDYQILTVISNNPENLKGVSPEKMTKETKTLGGIYKPIVDKMTSNAIQWSVVAVPSPEWAIKVFPDSNSPEEAVETMWEAIFAANLIDEGDPVENWNAHLKTLSERTKKLQSYNLKSLTFKNSLGTDIEIGLIKEHIWTGVTKTSKTTGNSFIANIPTYEVFTAPHRTEVNGIVHATKPLVYMGNIIDKFWIRFEKGCAVEYKAEIGQEFLEKLITIHPNSNFLGEVALVPYSSPISKSGILWYKTLYDENASCHIALGNGYSYTMSGSDGLSEEEKMAKGLNQSLAHTDFMIGSKCLSITGEAEDGSTIQIFENGEFVI